MKRQAKIVSGTWYELRLYPGTLTKMVADGAAKIVGSRHGSKMYTVDPEAYAQACQRRDEKCFGGG